VKWCLKHEGILDIAKSGAPDHYLVDALARMPEVHARGAAIGVAANIRPIWQASDRIGSE